VQPLRLEPGAHRRPGASDIPHCKLSHGGGERLEQLERLRPLLARDVDGRLRQWNGEQHRDERQ
jgi:hypothetical protein